MLAVYIEQIFRRDKAKNRSNMRILQGFLPTDIQIFANINLIGSSPIRLSAWAFDMPMSKVPLRCFCHSKDWGISVLLIVSLFESNSGKQSKK